MINEISSSEEESCVDNNDDINTYDDDTDFNSVPKRKIVRFNNVQKSKNDRNPQMTVLEPSKKLHQTVIDRRPKREWLLPEKFDGQNSSWSAFIAKFNICSAYNGWDNVDKLAHLQVALKGNAGHVLWSDTSKSWTFDSLVKTLNKRYGNSGQSALYRAELNARRRGATESLLDLHQDIIRLMSLAYEGPMTENTEAFAIEAFIKALGNTPLAGKVRESEPRDLDEAVKHAKRYESYTHCTKVNTDNEQGHYNKDGGRVRAVSNGKGEPKVNSVASVGPSLAEYQAVLNELRAFRESRQSAPMVMPPAIGQSLMQVAQGPWQAPMYPPHGSYPGHIPNTPVNNQQTNDQVNWHAQNYYNNNNNYNNNGALRGASGSRGGGESVFTVNNQGTGSLHVLIGEAQCKQWITPLRRELDLIQTDCWPVS